VNGYKIWIGDLDEAMHTSQKLYQWLQEGMEKDENHGDTEAYQMITDINVSRPSQHQKSYKSKAISM